MFFFVGVDVFGDIDVLVEIGYVWGFVVFFFLFVGFVVVDFVVVGIDVEVDDIIDY